MELTVKRDDIYSGLLKTQSIVEKRSTMPILSNVLLEAKKDSLKIRATDLELGVDTIYPAAVNKEGSLTVPGKKIFEMVRELDSEELKLSKKENNYLELKAGKAVFNILSLPSDDFPAFPAHDEKQLFKLPARIISNMIEKTIYAVSTDEIRYTLNGIFIERIEDVLRMVATDGHRLSLMDYKDPSIKGLNLGKGIIVPRKGAGELKKLIESNTDELLVNIKDNSGVFKTDNTVFVMRMIEGEYPDYKQVIPQEGEREAITDKDQLSRALKRVSVLSSEKSRGVKLSLRKGQIDLSTTNADIGEASESIDCTLSGDDVEIGFNARYLIEVLNSIDEDKVSIKIRDEYGPVRITGMGNNDHLSIIMPMRL